MQHQSMEEEEKILLLVKARHPEVLDLVWESGYGYDNEPVGRCIVILDDTWYERAVRSRSSASERCAPIDKIRGAVHEAVVATDMDADYVDTHLSIRIRLKSEHDQIQAGNSKQRTTWPRRRGRGKHVEEGQEALNRAGPILDYVRTRIEGIFEHPAAWGPPFAVELQFVMLVEFYLVSQGSPTGQVDRTSHRWWDHVDKSLASMSGFDLAAPRGWPLAYRLPSMAGGSAWADGATVKFLRIMRTFLVSEGIYNRWFCPDHDWEEFAVKKDIHGSCPICGGYLLE